jgi:hypothetical protein
MKTIDYSLISTSLGMLPNSGVLDWLQAGPKEVTNNVLRALFGIPKYRNAAPISVGRSYTIIDYQAGDDFTPAGASSNANGVSFTAGVGAVTWTNGSVLRVNNMYVLHGCVNTVSGGNNNISEGAVFWKDEVFLVQKAVIADPPVNGLVAVLVETSLTDSRHDPTSFDDGSTANVHIDRTIEIIDGTSASPGYICDFDKFVYVNTEKLTTDDTTLVSVGIGSITVSQFDFNAKIMGDKAFCDFVMIYTAVTGGPGTIIIDLPFNLAVKSVTYGSGASMGTAYNKGVKLLAGLSNIIGIEDGGSFPNQTVTISGQIILDIAYPG